MRNKATVSPVIRTAFALNLENFHFSEKSMRQLHQHVLSLWTFKTKACPINTWVQMDITETLTSGVAE